MIRFYLSTIFLVPCINVNEFQHQKLAGELGGHLNSLPSKAPKVCLLLPFFPSRSLFVPAQQSHWSERRRPRGGKQVQGCQSRTRPEQERTGLNRREQILAGPARVTAAARAPRYTYGVQGIRRRRSRSQTCWTEGGATVLRRFRFTRPSWWPVRSGSGHLDTFTVAVRKIGAAKDWGMGKGPGKQWGGQGTLAEVPSFRCYYHCYFS